MTYAVVLKQPLLNALAEECGLVVDENNRTITQLEIEYFAEMVVKECILTILKQKPEEGPTMIYNRLADRLKERFGIKE